MGARIIDPMIVFPGGLHTTGTAECPDLEGSKESPLSAWKILSVTNTAFLPTSWQHWLPSTMLATFLRVIRQQTVESSLLSEKCKTGSNLLSVGPMCVLPRPGERKSQIENLPMFPGAGLEGIYTAACLCICPERLTLSGEVR